MTGTDTGGLAQQHSPFFKLPLELRSKIYEEIIAFTIHSTPAKVNPRLKYHRTAYRRSSKDSVWPIRREALHVAYYKQCECPAAELLLVCKRINLDLQNFNASRKASGKPTARIDAIIFEDMVWVSQVAVPPRCPPQGHNVEIHIEIAFCEPYVPWTSLCRTLVKVFWEDWLMRWGSILDVKKNGHANRAIDNVAVRIRHSMNEFKESQELVGYFRKVETSEDFESKFNQSVESGLLWRSR